ncbi:type II secretion system F family protein [bacterium]|nr:type II secretion system F family protein [bacterium]
MILYQTNQSVWGRFFLDGLKLKVPVFGDLIRKYNVAQFSRNLAILYKSGVAIIPAIKTSIDSIENVVLIEALSSVAREVEGGVPIATSIQRVDVMPEIALQMIEVGEEAGSLDDMLEKVADFYEEEINYLVDQLTALIEPAFIVVLGTIVGTIVMAMYLPIFKMAKVITGGANAAPEIGQNL